MAQVRHIARLEYGSSLPAGDRIDGDVAVYGSNGPVGRHNSSNTGSPVVVVGRKGSHGKLQYSPNPVFAIDTTYFIDPTCTQANIRWLYYSLSTLGLDRVGQDVGVPGLSREYAYSQRVPLPSHPEQRAIADYLNTETSRIDTLITKKRRMIELLEQRLVSLATRLVTGDGESQASGIPSIPYVPHPWQVLRNKVFMHEVNERSRTGEEELLSVSHLTGVTPRSEKTVYMFKAESMVGYKLVRPGDLAVNTMWAWMGAAGVSRHRGIVSPSYGVYRIDQSTVLPDYFDLLVRTPAYVCEMTRNSRGVTSSRLRLYPDELLALRTPVPPIDIQNEIVRRFDDQADKARAAIDALVRQVEVLGERRTALITATVTGELAVPVDRG